LLYTVHYEFRHHLAAHQPGYIVGLIISHRLHRETYWPRSYKIVRLEPKRWRDTTKSIFFRPFASDMCPSRSNSFQHHCIQHMKMFHSHKLRAPKTADQDAATALARDGLWVVRTLNSGSLCRPDSWINLETSLVVVLQTYRIL